jgi:hypothetical protein
VLGELYLVRSKTRFSALEARYRTADGGILASLSKQDQLLGPNALTAAIVRPTCFTENADVGVKPASRGICRAGFVRTHTRPTFGLPFRQSAQYHLPGPKALTATIMRLTCLTENADVGVTPTICGICRAGFVRTLARLTSGLPFRQSEQHHLSRAQACVQSIISVTWSAESASVGETPRVGCIRRTVGIGTPGV